MAKKRKSLKSAKVIISKKIWQEKLGQAKSLDSVPNVFRKLIFATLAVNIFILTIVLLIHGLLPPVVPLFYGKATGENQLASSWLLTLPSVLSLSILLVNTILSNLTKDVFLKKALILTAMVVTFFSVVTTVKIILLIGSF